MKYINYLLLISCLGVFTSFTLLYAAIDTFNKAGEIKASVGDMQLICKAVKP